MWCRLRIKPQRLAADSAYRSAPMLNWLVEEKQITPYIPVIDSPSEKSLAVSSRSTHGAAAPALWCVLPLAVLVG